MDGAELKRRFGRRVQELREAKGLTQDRLASLTGRSVDTLSNIERGVNATRIETAYQLAQVLDVRLPDLFDFEDGLDAIDRERRNVLKTISRLVSRTDLNTMIRLKELIELGLKLAQAK